MLLKNFSGFLNIFLLAVYYTFVIFKRLLFIYLFIIFCLTLSQSLKNNLQKHNFWDFDKAEPWYCLTLIIFLFSFFLWLPFFLLFRFCNFCADVVNPYFLFFQLLRKLNKFRLWRFQLSLVPVPFGKVLRRVFTSTNISVQLCAFATP